MLKSTLFRAFYVLFFWGVLFSFLPFSSNAQGTPSSKEFVVITSNLSSGDEFEIDLDGKSFSTHSTPYIDLNGNKKLDDGEALSFGEAASLTWGKLGSVTIYADKITKLVINEAKIKNIELKQAPEISELDLSKNELTGLDISSLTILDRLDCSENPKLQKIVMCSNNPLRKFYAEKCNLKQIDLLDCANMEEIILNENQLQTLDFSKATGLTYLNVSRNKIDAKAMHKLVESLNKIAEDGKTFIVIDLNPEQEGKEANVCLKADVSLAKKRHWTVYDSALTEYEGSDPVVTNETEKIVITPTESTPSVIPIKISGENLWVDLNRDNKKDVGEELTNESSNFKNPGGIAPFSICGDKIKSLEINEADLSALDLTNASSLIAIVCRKNAPLKSVSLPAEKQKLAKLDLCGNKLSGTMDLSEYSALKSIDLSENELTSLVLGNKPELKQLYLASNKLSEFDLTHSGVLETLSFENNQVAELSFFGATELKNITARENKLTEVDLSHCNSLEIIDFEANEIEEITLPVESPHTKEVKLSNNKFSYIDLAAFTSAIQIDVAKNQLTEISMPVSKELSHLSLSDNKLSKIDLRGTPNLKHLYISKNQISSLDVSSLKNLMTLSIYGNQIKDESMTRLVKSLPKQEGMVLGDRVLVVVYAKEDGTIEDSNHITTTDVDLAKQRKWNVCSMNALGEANSYAGEIVAVEQINRTKVSTSLFNEKWIVSFQDDARHCVEGYDFSGQKLFEVTGENQLVIETDCKAILLSIDRGAQTLSLVQ
ncbi:MAG: hypothetical protein SPI35_00095 [Porphyromonas sp.]|nr:hypothetical protein [Porphyromonas sp.]